MVTVRGGPTDALGVFDLAARRFVGLAAEQDAFVYQRSAAS